ncbi:hypothetical protein KKE18_04200, partial [Patescibacteria group bacterium]|nr:hypothetical protein [Patescibacteria group bacterium]MBU1844858.1 hypothetical protein [Patescibacteria group bacterium]
LYLFTFLALIGSYFISLSLLSGENTLSLRSDRELVFMNLDRFSTQINEQRRASITFPATNLFYNKGTSLAKEVFAKYIGWLSPDHLLFGGDSPSIYRFGEHGVIYLLDIFFILLGVFGLARLKVHKNKNGFIFLLAALFIVAPLPSAVSKIGDSYFFRGFLLIPALIVLIACGVTFLYQELSKKHKKVAIGVTAVLYLTLFVNFLVFFFFRYPIKQQENHFLSGRVVSNYISRARENTDENIIVITTSPYAMYHQYLIYFNGQQVDTPQLRSKEHTIDNIIFRSGCDNYKEGEIVIFDSRLNCDLPEKGEVLVIQDQKDAGFQFSILNDNLCRNMALSPWRREHVVSDYMLEKMDTETFCNRWIYKYEI